MPDPSLNDNNWNPLVSNDPEWRQLIFDFFGSPMASLGTKNRSVDECVGFARKLLTGSDPYDGERRSLSEEAEILFSGPLPLRIDDRMPYLYLKHGLLTYSPVEREEFLNSTYGKLIKERIVNKMSKPFDFFEYPGVKYEF